MSTEETTQDDVNHDWNSMADKWDTIVGPTQYRDCLVQKLLDSNILIRNASQLLIVDFGCGTGLSMERLREMASTKTEFVMLDPAQEMVRVVQEKIQKWLKIPNAATAKVHCMALAHDNNALNHIHGKVDLIVASSAMNFIPKNIYVAP